MSSEEYRTRALSAYKNELGRIGATRINAFLRASQVSDGGEELSKYSTYEKTIRHICTIIRSIDAKLMPSPRNRSVYRGISADFYGALKATGVIVNKGYTSSTTDRRTAEAFAQDYNGGVVLVFMIPAGMRIHEYASKDEHEILIERNTQFINFQPEKRTGGLQFVKTSLVKYVTPNNADLPAQARKESVQMVKPYLSLLEELDKDDDLTWLKE